ncbi:MAG: DUF3256 family protein [Muribaculaceae bacterium]|nr:DUF3256 family protein [Muribaculaceae bacterium]
MSRFIISLLVFLGAASVSAQMTPRSVIMTAPEKVQLTIDASTMLDMLDYYDSGVARTVKNKAGEDAVITEMSPSTITIRTGEARTLTLAILPYGKSEIIMVIDRVDTPATDASVSFYDSRWNSLPVRKLLRVPALADWTGKVTPERMREIENALPFLMVDASYNPDTRVLTFTPQLGDYVAKENADMLKEALKPQLEYVWSGKSFKPVKK